MTMVEKDTMTDDGGTIDGASKSGLDGGHEETNYCQENQSSTIITNNVG